MFEIDFEAFSIRGIWSLLTLECTFIATIFADYNTEKSGLILRAFLIQSTAILCVIIIAYLVIVFLLGNVIYLFFL